MNAHHNRGFSLLELMIVVLVIGILAGIGVPIYSNSVIKAKQTEADIALASIRRALRIYECEHGQYPKEVHDNYVIGADWHDIKAGELTGKYFSDSSYTYRSANRIVYKLVCDKGDILPWDRTLNQDGVYANE